MIIGIDGNEANVKNRVGVGEYSFELLRQFKKFQISRLPAGKANFKFQIYLKEKPKEDLPRESEDWQYRIFGPKPFWTQFALSAHLYLERPRPDIFFTPTHYGPRFCPVPLVISVMDLSYIHFPQLFKRTDLYKLQNWTKYSVQKAKRVLTISNASKDDIIKEYHIAERDVVVTYPGIKQAISLTPHLYMLKDILQKHQISENYILFVGTLQPRKNIARLIEAYSFLALKNLKMLPDLVIVGKKGWLYEDILQAPERFGVKERVKFLHFVSDKELAVLYQHALFFILPSLYEGFGLPVLEAMKHGCPVITSRVSSLPEVAGDAALYVDPQEAEDIAEKMQKLLTDEKLRKILGEKGKKQVEKFSWEKTARETLKVLEDVVKSNQKTL